MIRFIALPVAAVPFLLLGLAAPQNALAQGEVESLYDSAPGLGPPPGDRGNRGGDPDGGLRDGDPELEELLDRLDRGGRRVPRRRGEEPPIDDFDVDEDDRRAPPRRERDAPDDPALEKAEPDLGHKVIAGLWSGTVEEVGEDPYTLRLSLKEDGTGTASYSSLNCASEIVPIAGRLLEYRETITMGRETCEDGIVQLRLRRGLLLWSWKDDRGEVRAAATLKRDIKKATDVPAPDESVKPKAIGDGVVNLPPEDMEHTAD